VDLDEESRELLLDPFRQDVRLSQTYAGPGGAVVRSPIHAWGGDHDGIVTATQLDGWRRYAGAGFYRRQFPGGHHFCSDQLDHVTTTLRSLLGVGKDR
jgi:surfactin synthase thioesterase subunit